MSPKRWILLLIFYISYLMFGASIYYHIEHGLEKLKRLDDIKKRKEINAYLLDELADKNATVQNEILQNITDYCGKPVTDYTQDEYEVPYTWTFYHAFFFSFTVCSTVGYGNISPTTTLGRMIMIIYSVIGIPVNGILFAGLGEYFGRTFEAIYRRYKKYKMSSDIQYVPPQLGLITTVVIALIPGVALFLLLPAWVFSYFEDWSYSIAFYYSYVTTTTIGFGDFVPTFGPNQPREFGGWFVVYQIFVIVWFIFSLGYLVMIMTFITRGLQSKKLAQLEQQLSTNLKATQNRIWTGVTKDVGYLRRLLNELYILKVKPVYTDADFAYTVTRSASCPELSMYRVEPAPLPARKRAFSVCAGVAAAEHLVHANSDTEISKFDREKTFETAEAYRQTTDLLAKVVTALATVKPPPPDAMDPDGDGNAALYGGYHGFSDSQILASEWSFSSMNDSSAQMPRRARACSDFNIQPAAHWRVQPQHRGVPYNEWTWSGDNEQIQEAFNKRYKHQANGGDPYVVHLEDTQASEEHLKKSNPAQRVKKFSMPDGLRKLFPFHRSKRSSQDVQRKLSVVSVPEGVSTTHAPLYDYNSTVTAGASPSYFHGAVTPPPPFAVSNNSIPSIAGITNHGFQLDDATGPSLGAYQRRMTLAPKRRRESIYTQNPAIAARRGSMYPPATGGSAALAANAARRGSLFPATAAANTPRRSSIFSVTSDKDMDVLEQTSIADLIRALEVVHTHAVLDEQQQAANANVGGKGSDRKQRKLGNAGLDPPHLPPILSLFAGDQTRSLQATAANRLYARRSTIVGTMPAAALGIAEGSRRLEPPPSYTEKPIISTAAAAAAPAPTPPTATSKFRRRFSVRPTALQIPPGQAPPPGVSLGEVSQTALQRRLSLRPSPLARETPPSSADEFSALSPTESAGSVQTPKPSTRLLAGVGGGPVPTRPSTSSTHSPLSRIVQISQAQRKSSMPEGFGTNARKPDK